MAYTYSALTPAATQFASNQRLISVNVTPDAATGSITVAEITTIDAIIGFGYNADLTANCYTMQVAIDGTTANKLNFKLWKAGGTAADTAFVGFWVTVQGH